MSNMIEKVKELRKLEEKAKGAVIFQDEQPEGEMIQVSPGCYEGGIDGYAPTGEVLIVNDPKDPDCYPETLANFDHPDDAAHYVALRNAAPTMLVVLAGFQPGDARLLDLAAETFGQWGDEESRQIRACLRRLAEMARRMEAER